MQSGQRKNASGWISTDEKLCSLILLVAKEISSPWQLLIYQAFYQQACNPNIAKNQLNPSMFFYNIAHLAMARVYQT